MGVQVHDARLVAAMKVHGVTRILTINIRDFSRCWWIVHASLVPSPGTSEVVFQ
jgi:hypothetical protein